MKRIKSLLAMLLIVALTLSMASCFIISGQKMRDLKGTYKLTTYTYTPTHERVEGRTPITYDYVNGEKYGYEDYLVITGTGMGYYVHKDALGECYVKEVTISYEYDEEGKNKIEYIVYNDALSVNSDESGTHRLGVNKKILNYSKSSFDYTQLITKKPMRSESLTVRWEKVDRATDLSYVTKVLGEVKYYEYSAFAERGIYELAPTDTAESTDEYLYHYLVIDSAKDNHSATIYYQLKNSDEQVKKTVSGESAPLIASGQVELGSDIYYTCVKVSESISEARLAELIEEKLQNAAE